MLYLVEYADYNSQAKLGSGVTKGSAIVASGTTDFLGMKSGSVDGTNTTSIIYRGIEDIFGNTWQFIDGINAQNNQVYICYDQTQYAVNTFTGCYKKIGYVNANSAANGFVSKLGYDLANPLVAFPIELNGSSSTGTSDEYWQYDENRIVLVGGDFTSTSSAGLWEWHFGATSGHNSFNVGARLIKIN
jgi:hypothetical protein